MKEAVIAGRLIVVFLSYHQSTESA